MAQRSRRPVRPIGLGHGWEPLEDRRVPALLGLGASLPDVFAPPTQGLDTVLPPPPVTDLITVSASLTLPVTDPVTVSVSVPTPTVSTDPVSVDVPAPSVSVGQTAPDGDTDTDADSDSTPPITLPLPSVGIDPTSSEPIVSVPIPDLPIVETILDPITSILDGDSASGGDPTSTPGGGSTPTSGGTDSSSGSAPGGDSTTKSPIVVDLPPIVVDLPPIVVDLPPIVIDPPTVTIDPPTVTIPLPTVTVDPPTASDPPDSSGGNSSGPPPTSTPSTGTNTPGGGTTIPTPITVTDPMAPPVSPIPSTGDGSITIIGGPSVIIEVPSVPVASKPVTTTETPVRPTTKPVVDVVKPDSLTVEDPISEIPINTDARSVVVPASMPVGFSGLSGVASGSVPMPTIEIARTATSSAAFVAPVATSSQSMAPMLFDWMPSPGGVETLRTGVRLALAEIGTPVLATPLEPFAFDFDSTFSMLQAALTTSPVATADVSGLIAEMGDFVASLQGDSVGRLVQMAAFSPWTWVTLGVVVVVTAELMRRELRNTSEAPALDNDPDLLAPWGIP